MNLCQFGVKVFLFLTQIAVMTFLEGWNHHRWSWKCQISKQILPLIEILISTHIYLTFDQTWLSWTLPSHPTSIQVILAASSQMTNPLIAYSTFLYNIPLHSLLVQNPKETMYHRSNQHNLRNHVPFWFSHWCLDVLICLVTWYFDHDASK